MFHGTKWELRRHHWKDSGKSLMWKGVNGRNGEEEVGLVKLSFEEIGRKRKKRDNSDYELWCLVECQVFLSIMLLKKIYVPPMICGLF